jgi:hypothetical protein
MLIRFVQAFFLTTALRVKGRFVGSGCSKDFDVYLF